jgi:hypothetical protein
MFFKLNKNYFFHFFLYKNKNKINQLFNDYKILLQTASYSIKSPHWIEKLINSKFYIFSIL